MSLKILSALTLGLLLTGCEVDDIFLLAKGEQYCSKEGGLYSLRYRKSTYVVQCNNGKVKWISPKVFNKITGKVAERYIKQKRNISDVRIIGD